MLTIIPQNIVGRCVLGRSRKDPHSPHGGNFCCPEGETKLFLIIVNVLGHPKGVGGLTSNFLRGGGMDVFWNDEHFFHEHFLHICPNYDNYHQFSCVMLLI
jgi:hypothetical protein